MKSLVLLPDGAEEMEAVITIDLLRRAGFEVVIAKCNNSEGLSVRCSRGVTLVADVHIESVSADNLKDFSSVILPGGMDAARFFERDSLMQSIIKDAYSNKSQLLAVICASPVSLKTLLKKAVVLTSHPSLKAELSGVCHYKEERVVYDSTVNLLTSRGPGTSFEFAFAIIERLAGKDVLDKVRPPLIMEAF